MTTEKLLEATSALYKLMPNSKILKVIPSRNGIVFLFQNETAAKYFYLTKKLIQIKNESPWYL